MHITQTDLLRTANILFILLYSASLNWVSNGRCSASKIPTTSSSVIASTRLRTRSIPTYSSGVISPRQQAVTKTKYTTYHWYITGLQVGHNIKQRTRSLKYCIQIQRGRSGAGMRSRVCLHRQESHLESVLFRDIKDLTSRLSLQPAVFIAYQCALLKALVIGRDYSNAGVALRRVLLLAVRARL